MLSSFGKKIFKGLVNRKQFVCIFAYLKFPKKYSFNYDLNKNVMAYNQAIFQHKMKLCPQVVTITSSTLAENMDMDYKIAMVDIATDLCPSWPKVLNLVRVREFMKNPV